MKRAVSLLICLLLLAGCAAPQETEVSAPAASAPVSEAARPLAAVERIEDADDVLDAVEARGGYAIRAAVLYWSGAKTQTYQVLLDYLLQPTVAGLEAEAVDAGGALELAAFDVVYLDESLLSSPDWDETAAAVMAFTDAGGAVLATNGFYDAFPLDFFGAASFEKVETFPAELTLPEGLGDLADLQTLIADFHRLYPEFVDAEALTARDYGWAMRPDGALPLADAGGAALYAVNQYGKGTVLFANPLLPNFYIQSAFSMEALDEDQTPFAATAASCNQLFLSEWAAYAAKRLYGFALDRVYGSYGSPAMSWELHYEEITGFENDSMAQFTALAEEARQIPSWTLVRNTYWWFARVETMSYLRNQGTDASPRFEMDFYENAYSSGTHVDSGGEWVNLFWKEDGGSYFDDHPEHACRLYPCAVDYNGDGREDFFAGSFDGTIWYYENLGMTGLDGRFRLSEAQQVTDPAGQALDTEYFSSPALCDVDGDGALDLLTGSDDGKILWFKGDGTLAFDRQGVLLDTSFPGQCMPALGDVDGDGTVDLMVGSNQGILLLYYGQREGGLLSFSPERMEAYSRDCADWDLGEWLAPTLVDYDGDGRLDILLGTFPGYVALLSGDGAGGFTFSGYLSSTEENFQGNHYVRFGNYCTPLLVDLDGDGARDLLCGYQEYGLAYPIDSPYFPLREALQTQMDFAADRHQYVGLHFLTNYRASREREAYELDAHKKAMEAYGLSTEGIGANQHTWHLSTLSPAQSVESLWDAGLLWESGYATGDYAPQYAAEAAISLPFFRMDGDERTILMQNCSVLPYRPSDWSDISGSWQMPVLVYYHCDLMYRSDQEARDYIQKAGAFRDQFGYVFCKEDQLMRASAAAINLTVDVSVEDGALVLTPGAASEDFALYDEAAQSAAGVRVDFADGLETAFSVDARVWKQTDDGYAVGLDGAVSLRPGGQNAARHLLQVNVPAEIEATEDGAVLAFTGDGMMQVTVAGAAATPDAGWTVDEYEDRTVFTKFGAAETLRIEYTA